jgi:hypothetical protein
MANLTPPSIIFQLSFSSLGGMEGGALQIPQVHPRILMNYNILVLFRHAGDYLFHNPTFDNPNWETVLVPSTGIPFTTTGPVFNQVVAFGINTNSNTPGIVTMTLKVTSQSGPAFTGLFAQKFNVLQF